ncbi:MULTISPECIES: FAD-binding oxidoreductase [unclassified Pseudomonas]|uniref:NAD(P)/FAD-dependent oxidoreductase n=1 Tax=unclassified Pseudomonas TaxID=196821 RepID=UPI001296DBB5|nr:MULTISPECIES: FAD-binding oxidoreductase [unclassified Pseudomonas]MDU7556304.1 FAD-binding oxidoreductase [Pseudomonas sp.]MQT44374.1 FAD-dependent oxidoreductase [Pseudomonas sp. FSL R10-0765]MQT51861.1 FAD-dependent oxidoreductase [Pseudomonas sp. FSL R10-2398]MQT56143.1 FAD-dependent oxidoreductase [Pseudomonas sp. FSL R10-0399]MQT99118.1 FAD-dependent oxidoreductase [Pseudomonas sp. FSL R10-2245]
MSAPVQRSQHTASYYAASSLPQPDHPVLQGDVVADVCVVGGGFSGLNTALELAERGMSVVLLEAHKIGWGASGRNGGQLIRGVGHGLDQFEGVIGKDGVRQMKLMGLEAVEIVRQRVERFNIACDLTWGYCDLANKPRDLEGFAEEAQELRDLGYRHETRLLQANEVHTVVGSDRYVGGFIDMGSGHLHPLNLALGEAAAAAQLGVKLFEHSAVTRIDYGPEVRVHTAQGSVRAKTLVLGCNAYLQGLNPHLSGKVLPAGSYIIATEPLTQAQAHALLPQNMAVCDQRVALDYYRLSADRRLLFGGACHYSGRDPQDIGAYMRPKMLDVFPHLKDVKIDYQWGGMIGIGANRLPQIGRLPDQPNVYYAQAYSGHGVNATHLAGKLLAEAISGQHSTGFDLFNQVPHITFPGGKYLRSPLLALGMLWHRLKELA